MKFIAKIFQKEHEIEISNFKENRTVSVNGEIKQAELQCIGENELYSLVVDNRSYQLYIKQNSTGYEVSLNSSKYCIKLEDEKTHLMRSLLKADEKPKGFVEIKAPMPGLVVKISVNEGQEINIGDSLFIIEAMKMENEIRAIVAGRIKKICISEKDSVDKDSLLMITE